MQTQEAMTQAERDDNIAQSKYGWRCGSSNVLLVAKGALSHDPLIVAGGLLSIGAQGGNWVLKSAAKRVTTPALILSGAVFALSGIHHGLATPADVEHFRFGLCKMAGIAILFHGKEAGEWLKDAPGMRLVSKMLRSRSGNIAEVVLAGGASFMAWEGIQKLVHPHAATDLKNGAITLAAMGLFVAGNRVRSRTSQLAALPRPASTSLPQPSLR